MAKRAATLRLPMSSPRLPRSKWLLDEQSFLREPELIDLVVDVVSPRLAVEVGSWKGHSAIRIARRMKGRGARLICVDTWLGSLEHWEDRRLLPHLHLENGHPTLYERFLSNVTASGQAAKIRPLPMIAEVAAVFLRRRGVRADLVYIDGAHDAPSVRRDLEGFSALLGARGVMFGDDYDWKDVRRTVGAFAEERALHLGALGPYWILCRHRAALVQILARRVLVPSPPRAAQRQRRSALKAIGRR